MRNQYQQSRDVFACKCKQTIQMSFVKFENERSLIENILLSNYSGNTGNIIHTKNCMNRI